MEISFTASELSQIIGLLLIIGVSISIFWKKP